MNCETCIKADMLEELRAKVNKLDQTVYLGNGQPPLTARLASIERALQTQTWLMRVTISAIATNIVGLLFIAVKSGILK